MSKNVTIKIDANTKKAENGIQKVTAEINKLAKNNAARSLSNLNGAVGLVSKSFKLVTDAVKKAWAAMNECAEAYKVQAKAEAALSQAARNNPYIDGTGVKRLKEYAGQLQGMSDIGDEASLKIMAQLASAGRTEEEIKKIMSAAIDVSASGLMGVEEAARAMNATYNGMAGTLGRQIGEVKNLTAEQLRHGDAVDIIAKKYNGLAKETADARVQLKNAMGDAKEELGASFNKALRPMQVFFTELISGWTSAAQARRKYNEAREKNEEGKGDTESYAIELGEVNDRIEQLQAERKALQELAKAYREFNAGNIKGNELQEAINAYNSATGSSMSITEISAMFDKYSEDVDSLYQSTMKSTLQQLNEYKTRAEELNKKIGAGQAEKQKQADAEKQAADEADAQAKQKKAAEDRQAAIDKNTAALKNRLDAIKQEFDLNEKLTGERDSLAEAQAVLNAQTSSYLSLLSDEKAQVSASSPLAKSRLKDIEKQKSAVAGLADAEAKRLAEEARRQDAQKALDEGTARNEDAINAKRQKAEEVIAQWQAEGGEAQKAQLLEQLSILDEQVQEYNSILASAEGNTAEGEALRAKMEEARKAIEGVQGAIDDIDFQNVMAQLQTVVNTIQQGMGQLTQTMQQGTDLALKQVERNADKDAEAAKEEYEAGILSYEEYQAKKDKIDKDAARKEYKIKMSQWAMNLAMAQANAAQAVVNALASGSPPINVLNAVTAGLLGAAQVVAVAGAKPPAPSFATGGFVGGKMNGAAMGADDTVINAKNGELIANAQQQRNLWEAMNGKFAGARPVVNLPITIENNAANEVSASAQTDERQITIAVNKIVNKEMANGVYSDSLRKAQGGFDGKRYY